MSEKEHTEKITTETRNGVNLTVYINIVPEKEASAEQKQAVEEMREIFAEMVSE